MVFRYPNKLNRPQVIFGQQRNLSLEDFDRKDKTETVAQILPQMTSNTLFLREDALMSLLPMRTKENLVSLNEKLRMSFRIWRR